VHDPVQQRQGCRRRDGRVGLVFDPALLINEYNKTEFADTFGGLDRVDVAVIASMVTPELTVPLFGDGEYGACLKA